jgi:hypothetical protein
MNWILRVRVRVRVSVRVRVLDKGQATHDPQIIVPPQFSADRSSVTY